MKNSSPVENEIAMKRITIILLLCLVGCTICLDASGQAQITTRKEKLKDMTTRITKVVVPGDDMMAEAIKESVSMEWTLSPFEFCTPAEFDALKTNPAHYFLLLAEKDGIRSLAFVKGGPEAAQGVDAMLLVTSFPLADAQTPSGREFIVMPAVIHIIQDLAGGLIRSEFKAYAKLSKYNRNLPKLRTKTLYIDREDIASSVGRKVLDELDEDILVEDEEAVNEAFTQAVYNGIISFVVAPAEPVSGAPCYKMLIGTDDHQLYYIQKHKITARKGRGFLAGDLKKIRKVR
jgi:hypothetical protein